MSLLCLSKPHTICLPIYTCYFLWLIQLPTNSLFYSHTGLLTVPWRCQWCFLMWACKLFWRAMWLTLCPLLSLCSNTLCFSGFYTNVGLELSAPRSRVSCFTGWTNQVSLKYHFFSMNPNMAAHLFCNTPIITVELMNPFALLYIFVYDLS